ncbi:MAG: hypothetical protein DCF26_01155 [Burkholderiales bacterium]|nr:MAG: hypothetical protein DCF26_01155 [Burkholderiales bacterium]
MYASLLHFARDEGYKGIRPTLKPDDILKKPREIWEKFSTDPFYSGKVVLKSENQLLEDSEKQSGKYSSEQKPILSRWKHPEDWLNKIYQLQPGSHLVDLAHMRKNAEAYWKHWESTGRSEESLDDFAQKLVRLSIDAHKNK